MKILYLVNTISNKGGIDRIVVDKANYSTEIFGNDVTICTVIDNQKAAYPLAAMVKHVRLCDYWDNRRLQKLPPLKLIKCVSNLLKEGHFDIIVNAQARYVTWVLPFMARRVPKIMEIHFSRVGMEYNMRTTSSKFRQWLYWSVVEYWYGLYDRFVVLSHGDSPYWPQKNLRVIHNFTRCENPTLPSKRENVVLCLARYHKQKRIDILINAWHRIYHKHPDWTVEIYGQGPEKVRLQQQVDELGLHDCFFLNDAIHDVAPVYARSSIFSLPSETEGFGLVLLEAMAAHLPICAFDIVGVSDVVESGKTGLLCDFPNEATFADNLEKLIDNENLRRSMGEAGFARLDLFSADRIMRQWQDLFEEVLASRATDRKKPI
jgi:glycosyltransferase involved in cell wall biosynthesis